jgi:hypothetical protein
VAPVLKQPSRIGVPVYVAGALCLLGAGVFAYLQRAPRPAVRDLPASPEAKAYVTNLHLSDVSMKATQSYALQTIVEIEGKIENAGNRPVESVEIYCYFYDAYGQMVFRPRIAIVTQRMGGLNSGETKSFRLPFDELPPSWNQTMPRMQIAGIKFRS